MIPPTTRPQAVTPSIIAKWSRLPTNIRGAACVVAGGFVLIVMAVGALLVYRLVSRRFAARFGKLDRIAAGVEENSRMLRQLLAEKGADARDAAARDDDDDDTGPGA